MLYYTSDHFQKLCTFFLQIWFQASEEKTVTGVPGAARRGMLGWGQGAIQAQEAPNI